MGKNQSKSGTIVKQQGGQIDGTSYGSLHKSRLRHPDCSSIMRNMEFLSKRNITKFLEIIATDSNNNTKKPFGGCKLRKEAKLLREKNRTNSCKSFLVPGEVTPRRVTCFRQAKQNASLSLIASKSNRVLLKEKVLDEILEGDEVSEKCLKEEEDEGGPVPVNDYSSSSYANSLDHDTVEMCNDDRLDTLVCIEDQTSCSKNKEVKIPKCLKDLFEPSIHPLPKPEFERVCKMSPPTEVIVPNKKKKERRGEQMIQGTFVEALKPLPLESLTLCCSNSISVAEGFNPHFQKAYSPQKKVPLKVVSPEGSHSFHSVVSEVITPSWRVFHPPESPRKRKRRRVSRAELTALGIALEDASVMSEGVSEHEEGDDVEELADNEEALIAYHTRLAEDEKKREKFERRITEQREKYVQMERRMAQRKSSSYTFQLKSPMYSPLTSTSTMTSAHKIPGEKGISSTCNNSNNYNSTSLNHPSRSSFPQFKIPKSLFSYPRKASLVRISDEPVVAAFGVALPRIDAYSGYFSLDKEQLHKLTEPDMELE